jgi:outer membrane protein assembly factor BamB
MSRKRIVTLIAFVALALPAASLVEGTALPDAAGGDSSGRQADGTAPWTMFGFNAGHSSVNSAAVSVTPQNGASLTQAWQFVTPPPTKVGQPAVGFDGSPVVVDGMVFIGSLTGIFYALNEDTGAVVWSLNAGYLPKYECAAVGIADTATVAADPTTGKATVYFADGDGTLWAVDAASGTPLWKAQVYPTPTSSAQFIWGSPLVSGGKVYIGISSQCDDPLVRGGLASFDQATGAHVATFWTVAASVIGGSIWSSAAESSAGIFVTTGNGNEADPSTQGLSNSIVLLNPKTLKVKSHWTVPNIATFDDDFGSSPTLFSATINGVATPMVGACDKNGYFYALAQKNLAAGPIWSDQLGTPAAEPSNACLAMASWDGSHLFITANTSTVGGVSYPAVTSELNPATGQALWQTGLSEGPVLGTSPIDGAGVVAAITFSGKSQTTTNQLALLNASNGALLATYPTTTRTGGGPVWGDGYLLFGGTDGILHCYSP